MGGSVRDQNHELTLVLIALLLAPMALNVVRYLRRSFR